MPVTLYSPESDCHSLPLKLTVMAMATVKVEVKKVRQGASISYHEELDCCEG